MPQRHRTTDCEAVGDLDWSALMDRAQQGDRDAYRRLLTETAPYIRAIARQNGLFSEDCEDAVQDVLLTVHAIRHTYDPRRPFGPWLATIARRRIIDRLRAQQRRTRIEKPLERRHETFAAAEANLHAPAERHRLHKAIAALPAGQRKAIVLLKLREMSLQAASQESGLSVASLKVAVHRAISALRKRLGQGRT